MARKNRVNASGRTRTTTPKSAAAPPTPQHGSPAHRDVPVRANLQEIGSTGLTQIGNIIGDLYENVDLNFVGPQWRTTIKKMCDTDPMIGSVLFAIEMLIRQVEWNVQAADDSPEAQAYATFVQECLDDMSMSWHDTLSEILTFLPYGWSYHEIVYKRRMGPNPNDGTKNSNYNDGRIGWRKWPLRGQVTLDHWDFDSDGGIRGMYQRLANFELVYLPIEKGLLFRTTSRMNSPEGRSVLLNAYRPWYFKKHIENIEGIGIERDLAGMPVASVPWQMLTRSATDEQKQIVAVIQKIVTNIKRDEQEGIVFPIGYDQKGNKEFDLKLLATGGARQFNAQTVDSLVLTPTGWKRMGDIKLGDEVIDPLGHPSQVVGVYPLGKRPVYRVTTSDDRSTVVDLEHLWTVSTSKWRARGSISDSHPLLPDHRVVTTKDLQERLVSHPDRRFALPETGPLQFASNGTLAMHPYVLGVLLGDGYLPGTANPRITSADYEIIAEVEKFLPSGDFIRFASDKNAGEADSYVIGGNAYKRQSHIKQSLIQLGLIGTKAATKFVPEPYLWASVGDRLSLLQGLMDTDGTIDKQGCITFGTTSERMAEGVLHLVRSLGGSAGLHSRKIVGYNSPLRGKGQSLDSHYYMVQNIRLPEGLVPFRLARKIERMKKMGATHHRAIVSVQAAGEAEVQCIRVSSPSQMYITDDFIPTHNTSDIIERYDLRIAMTLLADFVLLGHKGVGSFALSSNKMHLFSIALKSWLDSIASVINAHAIPRLMQLNGFPTDKSPRLNHADVENAPLSELGAYVDTLAKAGLLQSTPELQRFLLSAANLPVPAETEGNTIVTDLDKEEDDGQTTDLPGNIPPPDRVDQSPPG